MQVFRSIAGWISFRRSAALKGQSLGFVPTMGALHEGHLSLVGESKKHNDRTVVSIFVNPTQFDDPRDLEKYPRPIEQDLEKLKAAGCDFVLLPEYGELYPDNYRYKVQENELSRILCGAHRPGHFDGVLTVVLRLLNLAGADRAYFGEKDYQQYLLVKGMAESFFHPTEIIGHPIVREADGLAMSSRNVRLTTDERARAAAFPRLLGAKRSPEEIRGELEKLGFDVDYIEEGFGRRFGAVRLGKVRLIDNVQI